MAQDIKKTLTYSEWIIIISIIFFIISMGVVAHYKKAAMKAQIVDYLHSESN